MNETSDLTLDEVSNRIKLLFLWNHWEVQDSNEEHILKSIYMKLLSFSEVTTAVNFLTGR